jgi:nucleotide-binding universal stress UspA family protein
VKGSLLVPLDGSEAAEHAIPYAIAIARAAHLPIELLHVLTLDSSIALGDRSFGYDSVTHPDDIGDRVDEAHDYLDRIADLVRERITTRVSTAVHCDLPADGIRQIAHDAGCALIIMTRHTRRGFPIPWMGSVADSVVRASGLPVLIVPPRAGKANLDNVPVIRRILLPVDGSELSDEVLPIARNISPATGVHFTLFWVGRRPLDGVKSSDQRERERDENRHMISYLLERAAAFVPGTVDVVVSRLSTESVAATIMKEGDETEADIVGMATHARGLVGRALKGSVADQVLHDAARPILVYHPAPTAAERLRLRTMWQRAGSESAALL